MNGENIPSFAAVQQHGSVQHKEVSGHWASSEVEVGVRDGLCDNDVIKFISTISTLTQFTHTHTHTQRERERETNNETGARTGCLIAYLHEKLKGKRYCSWQEWKLR